MKSFRVKFLPLGVESRVAAGASVYDAALTHGIQLRGECGGLGSCGQCVVKIDAGACPPTPHASITPDRERRGYRLACAARVEDDLVVFVPEESLLPSASVDYAAVVLSEDDRKRDRALAGVEPSPPLNLPPGIARPLGLALDLGTTTVVAEFVNLRAGNCVSRAAAYNRQLSCGTDIISRITYAERPGGLEWLRGLALETINDLLARLMEHSRVGPGDLIIAIVAGNTTMVHLFLGMDPSGIRLGSFTAAHTRYPAIPAREAGVKIDPLAPVMFAPGVGSYVGGDVTAGVLACRMHECDEVTLFIDAGTNGEIVLGNREWMMGCACSTGPAFEGVGIASGMIAAPGAIEEVHIRDLDAAPRLGVIGGAPARGICGSGMIDLMAELFRHGILDRNGALNAGSRCPRLAERDGHPVYLVRTRGEDCAARDIYLNDVDFKKLLRTKAAIQAAIRTMLKNVELDAREIGRVVIAGRLGEAIDAGNAIAIGMLPDLPLERFDYIGNGSLWGANLMLLSKERGVALEAIADRITYLDLSTHPGYMEEYVASLFIPHTD
ncbi:MAG: ASKHA domain-containing protein [Candidatus Aureabacteria bacterium]|nr:ASKHA domain-containing protein [Candidatus Auribacterota bacterium]